jgi:hypothetical protein
MWVSANAKYRNRDQFVCVFLRKYSKSILNLRENMIWLIAEMSIKTADENHHAEIKLYQPGT